MTSDPEEQPIERTDQIVAPMSYRTDRCTKMARRKIRKKPHHHHTVASIDQGDRAT